jgi:hypothetical protein
METICRTSTCREKIASYFSYSSYYRNLAIHHVEKRATEASFRRQKFGMSSTSRYGVPVPHSSLSARDASCDSVSNACYGLRPITLMVPKVPSRQLGWGSSRKKVDRFSHGFKVPKPPRHTKVSKGSSSGASTTSLHVVR